jgi:hypothetical protein
VQPTTRLPNPTRFAVHFAGRATAATLSTAILLWSF